MIVEDQPQPETKMVDGFVEMADGETAAPRTTLSLRQRRGWERASRGKSAARKNRRLR